MIMVNCIIEEIGQIKNLGEWEGLCRCWKFWDFPRMLCTAWWYWLDR